MALLTPYQAALHAYRSYGRSVAFFFAEFADFKHGPNHPDTMAAFKAIEDLDGTRRSPPLRIPADAPVTLSNGSRSGCRKPGRSVD